MFSENYTFYVAHNDGIKLWVNGQQIINNWANQATEVETASSTIALSPGQKYDIKLEFFDNTGAASVRLLWSSASQSKQVIPATQLYPPEGQLAFWGRESGNEEVYFINPDGTGEQNLSSNAAVDRNPVWSPDGSQVAFISTRDGNEEIYVVNANGTNLRRLTNSLGIDQQPAWSPDGTRIAFASSRTGSGDIYTLVVPASGPNVPTATRITSQAYNEGNPIWSTNGMLIAFEATPTTNTEIFVMTATGTNRRNLTNRAGIDAAPYWSPDGTKLVVRAPGSSVSDQIWLITLTSTTQTVTQLTDLGNNYFQSWSPDGSKILFMSTRTGDADVFSMNVDGSSETNLSNTVGVNESYAVWPADARYVAFIRTGDIYIMNRDGSQQRQLTNTPLRTEREIVWWQTKQTN